jgi:hypothetical protein
MNNSQQRKLSKYQAEEAFMADNAADFPDESAGQRTAAELGAIIVRIQGLSGEQRSNMARQSIGLKADKLQQLIELLQMMNRAASAMADEVDGIETLFRMPRRRSEEIWLSTARAFHRDSAPFERQFLGYDLPPAFRADLMTLINEVEAAAAAANIAGGQRAGATGGLTEAFKTAGQLSRKLNAIVLNKYNRNAQKLAAWAVASHLEAASRQREAPAAPAA